MPSASHMILLCVYAALAIGAGFAAPILFDAPPVLIGAIVFLACALIHEAWSRRVNEARLIRSIRIMKTAYDRLQEGGTTHPPAAPTQPDSGSGHQEPPSSRVHDSAAPVPDRPRAEERPQTDRPASVSEPPQEQGLAPASEAAPATERSEIALLQRLLNTLRTSDDPGLRPEPGIEEADGPAADADGATRRGGLRVVGGSESADDGTASVLDLVQQGLRDDRVDLYLQPIVSLPQRKRRFFECYSRVRTEDGEVIEPGAYLDAAKATGLLTSIDNILLFRCLQLLGKLQRTDATAVFFCNVSANTLADDDFVQDIVSYMERHRELSSKLVLEMAQTDLSDAPENLPDYLAALQKAGYRFSMDGIRDLDLDIAIMAEKGFRSIKVDAAILLELIEAGRGSVVRSLKQNLDHHGIDLIVERIESEKVLLELLDFNIDYGQGFLFGEPRPSKDPGAQDRAGESR